MLALTASALLGLYVFLPIALFDKLAGPFVRSDAEAVGKIGDYKTVFSCVYSDHYFDYHSTQFWVSLRRVLFHQSRFVTWNYTFLLVEIAIVSGITFYYGYLNNNVFFRKTVGRLLLSRVSEWTPLLTTFLFDPTEELRVEVDLMAANGILLRGTVSDHFLDKDGGLRGLLLKDAKRYQYSKLQEDRKKNQATALTDYWKPIPGANFYVPYDSGCKHLGCFPKSD